MKNLNPTVAMVCASGCWGSATVLSKAVVAECPASLLLVLQLCGSVAFLFMVSQILGHRPARVSKRFVLGSLLGLIEPGAAYLCILLGLERVSASTAAVICSLEPVCVVLLVAIIRRTGLSKLMVCAAFAGVIGSSLIAVEGTGLSGATSSLTGLLFTAAGTVLAAVYVVFSPYALAGQSPIVVAVSQQFVGLLGVLLGLVIFSQGTLTALGALSTSTILVAAFSGIVQYGLAFWSYLIAIQRLAVSQATILLNLIPVFSVGTAAIFLGERMILVQWLGAILIGVAVLLARKGELVRV